MRDRFPDSARATDDKGCLTSEFYSDISSVRATANLLTAILPCVYKLFLGFEILPDEIPFPSAVIRQGGSLRRVLGVLFGDGANPSPL